MASRRLVRIPEEERAVIHVIHGMTDDDFHALLETASSVYPRLSIDEFGSSVELEWQRLGHHSEIKSIVELAANAARTVGVEGLRIDEVIDAVVGLVIAEIPDDQKLRARLSQLIQIRSVIQTAVSGPLLTAHPIIYRSAKIYSDLRPLFMTDDQEQGPSVSVLIHQLELRVYKSGSEEKVFLALDDNDLIELRDALEEAMKRSSLLKTFESGAGRTIISR